MGGESFGDRVVWLGLRERTLKSAFLSGAEGLGFWARVVAEMCARWALGVGYG